MKVYMKSMGRITEFREGDKTVIQVDPTIAETRDGEPHRPLTFSLADKLGSIKFTKGN